MLKFTATHRTGQAEMDSGVFGTFYLRAGDIESVTSGPDGGACILTATRGYIVSESVQQVLEAMGFNVSQEVARSSESAAQYLRDMSEAMADGVVESSPTDIKRLAQIAADLDMLLGAAVPRAGSGATFEAVQRLRGNGS